MEDLLAGLTPAQREAVQHVDGPLLILAGPGSGKTRVVTHRIAHLLRKGVPARQLLALTFTNKAADEMRARVERLAPDEPVWLSTFHRFCARLLRQYAALVGLEPNFAIYDTADSGAALRRTLEAPEFADFYGTPEQIAHSISWAKNNLIPPSRYAQRAGSPLGAVTEAVYPAYQARLLRSNAVDFDDLLMHVATLLRENPEVRRDLDARYRYIMVDEYQDTNLAQYTIVRALSIDYPNLAVTGDPDQSIYGWRGASISNILDFEKDYPNVKVVRLEQNYRSTPSILRVAAALIANNVRRKAKDLYTDNAEGPPPRLTQYFDQRAEAESIAARISAEVRAGRRRPRDFAVFYRTNALSRAIETAFREAGVPYQMINGLEFYQRKEIKDVLSYLALLNNPRDDVALRRVINTPARNIGKTTLERLEEHALRKGMTLLEAARESGLVESLSSRTAVAVARFVAIVDRLGALAHLPVEEVLGHVLTETGYEEALKNSEAAEDQDRLANIQELLTAARQFDEQRHGAGHLEEFLESCCLVNDTDAWETSDDRATMMTLHASKGLEFPVVFIVALEEGLLPHQRSRHDPAQTEEERRLLFVGMTRAEQELHMSHVLWRDFRGRRDRAVVSSFVMEMPRDEMQVEVLDEAAASRYEDSHRGGDESQAVDDLPDWVTETDEEEAATPTSVSAPLRLHLTTAAELAGATVGGERFPIEAFHHGMIVRHPEYGLGKIVALSGSGPRRRATVAFASSAGERSFVLSASPLRPAKDSS